MATDGTVTSLQIAGAEGIVGGLRPHLALRRLTEIEPSLGAYVDRRCREVLALLEAVNAPPQLCASVSMRILSTTLSCIEAVRRAHYDLWAASEVGQKMATFDPSLSDLETLGQYREQHAADTTPHAALRAAQSLTRTCVSLKQLDLPPQLTVVLCRRVAETWARARDFSFPPSGTACLSESTETLVKDLIAALRPHATSNAVEQDEARGTK
jgi:hypothetical protein